MNNPSLLYRISSVIFFLSFLVCVVLAAAFVAAREHKLQEKEASVRQVQAASSSAAAATDSVPAAEEEREFEPTQFLLLGVPESANDEFVSLFLVSTTKRVVVSLTVCHESCRALAALDAPCGK